MRARIYSRQLRKPKEGGPKAVWYIDTDCDGFRVRRRVGSREEAKAALAAVKADEMRGEYNVALGRWPRLCEFKDQYLEYVKSKGRVWKRHEASLKQLMPHFGDLQLSRIKLDHVITYRLKREKSVSDATINRELACLRHLLNLAKKKNLLSRHPVTKEDCFAPEPRKLRYIPTLEEIRTLLEEIDEKAPHLRLAIAISLHCSLRKSEILSLRFADIDFANHRIRVEKTKSGGERVFPMNSILEKMLIEARRENTTEYLFPSFARGDKERKEIRPMLDIKRSFQTAKREAMKRFPQLKSMTFHSFRHASAVMAWNNGASGAAIQQMLGHKSWRTTDIYLQTISASLKQASDILGRGFGDLTKIEGTRGAQGRFLESADSR